jgi:uncharacterized protein YndB with AHSA1/START domain
VAWWGDRTKWWVTHAGVDLRVGGEFWLSWENTKGESDRMGGRYRAIEPGKRLVCSFVGSHAKGIVDQLEIVLHAEGSGTQVVLRHSGLAGRPERYADYRSGVDADSRLARAAVPRLISAFPRSKPLPNTALHRTRTRNLSGRKRYSSVRVDSRL